MIVVTNASPLMALAKLGLLHLLGRLYGKVQMPRAVYDEVVRKKGPALDIGQIGL